MNGTNWRIVHLDRIDSTNSEVLRRASDGELPGLIVVADYQSAGRGRLERRWESPPGANLLASFLLAMPADPRARWQIPGALAVAAATAIETTCGIVARVKWPNDLLVGGEKVAGILTESASSPTGPALSAVGIGVNCLEPGPPEVSSTSLSLAAGRDVAPGALLDELIDSLSDALEHLVDPDDPSRLLERLRAQSATIGAEVKVIHLDGRIEVGRATTIDRSGCLVIETVTGLHAVSEGDVEHLR